MQPWRPRIVSAADDPTAAEWPAGLWRQLLIDSEVPFGARVLVIGCRHPELVASLDECSFDVDGIDDHPETIEMASRLLPKFNFTFARLEDKAPAPAHDVDLVLVQEFDLYEHDLLGSSARQATARLLSCLRPQGQLAVIRRMAGHREVDSGHEPLCWTKHFACFPGRTEVTEFADPWLSRSTWNWLRGKAARGTHAVIRHEPPLELLSRERWLDYARRAPSASGESCCEAARAPIAMPLRRAA